MAAPKGPELGMRQPLILRAGNGFEFEGLQKQWDPGGLPPGALQDAQNARLVGGRLVCRGGLSGAIGDALDGSVIGLFDDREDWVAPGGYGDEFGGILTDTVWFITSDPDGGYGLGYWDGSQVVMVEDRAGMAFSTLNQIGPGNQMYVSAGAHVYLVNPPTIDDLDVGEVELLGRGCAYDPVTGDLWFADGGGSIETFDGVDLVFSEYATGQTIGLLMTYGGDVQLLTPTALLERNAGAWDVSHALPDIGPDIYSGAPSWFVRSDVLWFSMASVNVGTSVFSVHILSFDGADVYLERTIAAAWGGALARVLGEEPLYYAYQETDSQEIHIGRYSGAVWDDDYCVGDGSTYGSPTEMVAHQDGYILLATQNGYLLKSGADPTDFSSYTVVGTGLGTNGIYWFWQERAAE
jgi:hypothetical protein